jgi:hypothetical protein
MCKEAASLILDSCFSGVRLGALIGKMKQLETQGHDLRQRVAQLAPEQQFTFALLQTGHLERIWQTVSLEDALKLAAGVLDVPEDELMEELDEAVELARERLEGLEPL